MMRVTKQRYLLGSIGTAVAVVAVLIGYSLRTEPHAIAVRVGAAPARAELAADRAVLTPNGVAVDGNGDVYISDLAHHVVDEVTPGGDLSVVAGIPGIGGTAIPGPASSSELSYPAGLAVDSSGDLFIADAGTDGVVDEVSATTGALSVVAGVLGGIGAVVPGPATSSDLADPLSVAVDSSGDLFIADTDHSTVDEVSSGTLSVVAGLPGNIAAPTPGPATSSALYEPTSVAVDSSGDVYIADALNHVVEEVSDGALSVVAGIPGQSGAPTSGPATESDLDEPTGLTLDSAGDLYIADPLNHVVEEVAAPTGALSIVAGVPGQSGVPTPGPATASELASPSSVAVDSAGDLYVADSANNVVEEVAASTGTLSIFAGTGHTTALAAAATNASTLISDRLRTVEGAMPGVHKAKWLSPADKSAALAILQNDQTGLDNLAFKIASDAAASVAKADLQTVYTDYRVYHLGLPQILLAAAADDLLDGTVPNLTNIYNQLQALLSGSDQSEDSLAVQQAMSDLSSQIGTIDSDTSGLAAAVLAFTPAQWNSDPSLLAPPKSTVKAAKVAASTAHQDVATVESALGISKVPTTAMTDLSTANSASQAAGNDLTTAAQSEAQYDGPP